MKSHISMYAKCGDLDLARQISLQFTNNNNNKDIITLNFDTGDVFEQCKDHISSPSESTILWTAIIHAYSIHGNPSESMSLFDEMQKRNIIPNSSTFLCLLYSCSHGGKVEQAWDIFCSMANFKWNLMIGIIIDW